MTNIINISTLNNLTRAVMYDHNHFTRDDNNYYKIIVNYLFAVLMINISFLCI